MAAATVSQKKTTYAGTDCQIQEFLLSAMTADQAEDVAHAGPSGVAPALVHYSVYTAPTSGEVATLEWNQASDSTTNNTVRLKPRVENGGDIAGCVFKVFVVFIGRASGGLNP